jgi:hypothetical protein
MTTEVKNTPTPLVEFPPELFTTAEAERIEFYFARRFAKIEAKHRVELAALEQQLVTAKQQTVAL